MASKKQLREEVASLERWLEAGKRQAVKFYSELENAREDLADVKAAWKHDQAQRVAAEEALKIVMKERDDLRRQLDKVREAHEKEHEALYPESIGKWTLGAKRLDAILPKGMTRC